MKKAVIALLFAGGACWGQISGAGSFGCNGQAFTGATWTSSTTVSTTQPLATAIVGPTVTLVLDTSAGSFSGGAITIQEDPGDGNFVAVDAFRVVDPTAAPFSAISLPYTLVTNTAKQFMIITTGIANLQLTISTAITGTGTLTPHWLTNCALQKQFTQGNISQWVGTTLGAPSNYGTSPGAVTVPGVNAFITNTPTNNTTQLNSTTIDTNSGNKSAGTQRVVIATDQPNLTTALNVAVPSNISVNDSQTGGASTSTAASGVKKVGVVGNAGAAFDAATGAAPPTNGVLAVGLGSGATSGFMLAIPVCDTFKNVNISTATTTLIVTGVSGRHVRICQLNMVTALANNVGIISGTGATCGTGTGAIVGTTAATGYNFAANGGIATGSGIGEIMQTVATGDSVCFVTSAGTQLSGVVSYTIY